MLNEIASQNADYSSIHAMGEAMELELFLQTLNQNHGKRGTLKISNFENEIKDYLNSNAFLYKEFKYFMNDERFIDPEHIANKQFAMYVLTRIFGEKPLFIELYFNKESNSYVYHTNRFTYFIPFEILEMRFFDDRLKFMRVKNKQKPKVDNWLTRKIDHAFGLDKKSDYSWETVSDYTEILSMPPEGFDGQRDWRVAYLIFTRLCALLSEGF